MMKNKKRNQMLCIACAAAILLSFGACKKAETPSQTTTLAADTQTDTFAVTSSMPSKMDSTLATAETKTASKNAKKTTAMAKTTTQSTALESTTEQNLAMRIPPTTPEEALALFRYHISTVEKTMRVEGTEKSKSYVHSKLSSKISEDFNKNNVVNSLPYSGGVKLTIADLERTDFDYVDNNYIITLNVKDENNPSSTNSATARAFGRIDTHQEIITDIKKATGNLVSLEHFFELTSITLTVDLLTYTPKKLSIKSNECFSKDQFYSGRLVEVEHTYTYNFK